MRHRIPIFLSRTSIHIALSALIGVTLLSPARTAFAADPPPLTVHVASVQPKQGDVLIVRVSAADAMTVTGSLGESVMHFAPDKAAKRDGFIGIIGIGALTAPGKTALTVSATDGDGVTRDGAKSITVRAGGYITERVTIPVSLTNTLDPALSQDEESEIAEVYAGYTVTQTWRGPLRLPARGKIVAGYGNHRIYNGADLGTYHSGVDISAVAGVTVTAAAPGTVVFAKLLLVRGNTVIIDHGRGVFTSYYHMRKIAVTPGQAVKTGQKLGEVGTTGRSQGNHVHFELAVGGVTVDPEYWTRTALP